MRGEFWGIEISLQVGEYLVDVVELCWDMISNDCGCSRVQILCCIPLPDLCANIVVLGTCVECRSEGSPNELCMLEIPAV